MEHQSWYAWLFQDGNETACLYRNLDAWSKIIAYCFDVLACLVPELNHINVCITQELR